MFDKTATTDNIIYAQLESTRLLTNLSRISVCLCAMYKAIPERYIQEVHLHITMFISNTIVLKKKKRNIASIHYVYVNLSYIIINNHVLKRRLNNSPINGASGPFSSLEYFEFISSAFQWMFTLFCYSCTEIADSIAGSAAAAAIDQKTNHLKSTKMKSLPSVNIY